MARGCLSASKASRRKRVPLPTLCEVQYGRNKWQKGVYCSSYHLHNFRSLSAPPSDMLQTTFYRPSQTNEPVTIGCRTPRVLNYLQRARTFGFTNLPLSLQLQNETLKADISAGGDGVEQISKTAKRMLQERMRKEKEKLRNAQQKSSGRHWVAALNRWVRDDKVLYVNHAITKHVPMRQSVDSRASTTCKTNIRMTSAKKLLGIVDQPIGDVNTKDKRDNHYINITTPLLRKKRGATNSSVEQRLGYDMKQSQYGDISFARKMLKHTVCKNPNQIEKWVVDHIEVVSESELVLPKVTSKEGIDEEENGRQEVELKKKHKRSKKLAHLRRKRHPVLASREGPWSYFGAFGQFGEPGQICLIDQSDLYNHDIHDIRNRRARERRRSSLEFREELESLRRMFHLPDITLGMGMELSDSEKKLELESAGSSTASGRRSIGREPSPQIGLGAHPQSWEGGEAESRAKSQLGSISESERGTHSGHESDSSHAGVNKSLPRGSSLREATESIQMSRLQLARQQPHRDERKKRRKRQRKGHHKARHSVTEEPVESGVVERRLSKQHECSSVDHLLEGLPSGEKVNDKDSHKERSSPEGRRVSDVVDLPPMESNSKPQPLSMLLERRQSSQRRSRGRGDFEDLGSKSQPSQRKARASHATNKIEEEPQAPPVNVLIPTPQSQKSSFVKKSPPLRRSVLPSIASKLPPVKDREEKEEENAENKKDDREEEDGRISVVSKMESEQNQYPGPVDLRSLSLKLMEEGYNRKEVREKLVKELKRVRAIMMRHASIKPAKKRQTIIACLNADDEEEALDPESEWIMDYCILKEHQEKVYAAVFDTIDVTKKGWLNSEDTLLALKSVSTGMTNAEETYLHRVLEVAGYNMKEGTDYKVFSIMAALSNKIKLLDAWLKSVLNSLDLRQMEMKLFKCKTLWEVCADSHTKSITLDQLCVILRMGGVSLPHELDVRKRFKNLDAIALVDFLTYVPLFIVIHESVIANPLNTIRCN